MIWIEPAIEAVTTSEVIYYAARHKTTCTRICQILDIDLFPDSNHNTYWQLDDLEWLEKEINYEQKVDGTIRAFSKEIIDKMALTPSNILFLFTGGHLNGVIHFTNYANNIVYQSLYQNFFEFEINLRDYLSHLGFTYDDVERYYEYKLNKDKNAKNREHFSSRLEELRSERFKTEAKGLSNLQKLNLRETLLFAKSSYHDKDQKKEIGLSDINEKHLSDLRNTIMHAKGITGSNAELAHDFSSFQEFFQQVLCFKKAFNTLKKLRAQQINEFNIKFNDYTLALLGGFSDKEIETFFYTRR